MKTRRIARGSERAFSKSGRMTETREQIKRSTRTIAAALSIQKFSNFVLMLL